MNSRLLYLTDVLARMHFMGGWILTCSLSNNSFSRSKWLNKNAPKVKYIRSPTPTKRNLAFSSWRWILAKQPSLKVSFFSSVKLHFLIILLPSPLKCLATCWLEVNPFDVCREQIEFCASLSMKVPHSSVGAGARRDSMRRRTWRGRWLPDSMAGAAALGGIATAELWVGLP